MNALTHANRATVTTSQSQALANIYKRYKAGLIASYLSQYGPGQIIEQRLAGGIRCYMESLAPGQANPDFEAVLAGMEKRLTRPDFLEATEIFRKASSLSPANAELVLFGMGKEVKWEIRKRVESVEKLPYVRRPVDQQVINALLDANLAPISIQSTKQRGKTRLLKRSLLVAKTLCYRSAYLDFGKIEKFVTPVALYKWMVLQIEGQLGIRHLSRLWQEELPPQQAFIFYLQQNILPHCTQGLVLGIDNIDVLLQANLNVGSEFLQLIRNISQSEEWAKKLKFVLTHTVDKLENKTPFTSGIFVQVGRLAAPEVFTLSVHYNVQLDDEELIDVMRQTRGGHPPAVHQLLAKLGS